MKYLLIILLLSSCAICRPPRNGAEMEKRVRKHDLKPFIVQQWVKYKNGYYVVHTIKSNRTRSDKAFECKPDSIQLAEL